MIDQNELHTVVNSCVPEGFTVSARQVDSVGILLNDNMEIEMDTSMRN
jgi:hypothetical protein